MFSVRHVRKGVPTDAEVIRIRGVININGILGDEGADVDSCVSLE